MVELKRCLVTGGAGFIGSHIVDELLEQGHTVSVVDDMSTGKLENIPQPVRLHNLDIRGDLTSAFEQEKPQVVFHHAAQISVSVSVREPIEDAEVNIVGSINLMEHCRRYGVERVIYASSGASYGEPESLPLREEGPTLGISPYGISKYMVERYLYFYRHHYGIPFVALRYANVYGPRQDPHGEAGVVAIFCEKLLRGEEVFIFGDGEQTRDFVFVKDIALANRMAMEKDLDPESQRLPWFNVSTQAQTTVNTIYGLIAAGVGTKKTAEHVAERVGDVRDACLANEKIKPALGWQPATALEEGIRQTVEFFRNKMKTASS